MVLKLPAWVLKKFWPNDTYGAIDRSPVSWNAPADPTGIWNTDPTAATVPRSSSRQNVHFGPSHSSANPNSSPYSGERGLTYCPPSLLMTKLHRWPRATRAWVPTNDRSPPMKFGWLVGTFW